MRVLIVGGYGVFGGRLARLLLREPRFEVIVAGRSLNEGSAFCAAHGGQAAVLDRDTDLSGTLERLKPDVVVDAAGPFQDLAGPSSDRYGLARAAIRSGAHYLDLSDDTAFTEGITALDALARNASRSALSGVSSVPALSAAVVRHLAADLTSIAAIDTVILPGNRAPRGLSVMRGILSQVGHPLRQWRGGRWTATPAWSSLKRETFDADGELQLSPRWASPIGAPDLTLFPIRFKAGSVSFHAGLEFGMLHLGLWGLGFLVRAGLIRNLATWAVPLRWLADRFLLLGTDRGGMRVRVIGRRQDGVAVERTWQLIASAGEGPFVPALPACALLRRLADGWSWPPGARPCLDDLDLPDFDAARSSLAMRTSVRERRAPTLYEAVLGDHAWATLPAAVRDLHDLQDQAVFAGLSAVDAAPRILPRLLRLAMGMPESAAELPVTVTLERIGRSEKWTRQFGRYRFSSVLSHARDGTLRERFGLLSFEVALTGGSAGISMPVNRAWLLGIPLPRWFVPISDTREWVDEPGRFCFDVAVSLPFCGPVIRYTGWLIRQGQLA